jgi:hypothetical protein
MARGFGGGLAGAGLLTFLSVAGTGGAAAADELFRCEREEAVGVSEADATTATRLLCAELRRASNGRGDFRISLGTLGRTVVVTVARADGAASITMRLAGLEELPVAAGRTAEALVHGQPLAATQRVDNLLADETRPLPEKKGALKFTVGVADVESPGFGARAAGFSVGLAYVTPRFALPAEMRFAWDDASYPDPQLDLFSVSVGGRAYLSRRDVSPFLGGGLGLLRLHGQEGEFPTSAQASSTYFSAERLGVAPYLEAGVEVLRLHRARIALQVRADLPTAPLKSPQIPVYGDWDYRDPVPAPLYVNPGQSRYVVPVSIGITASF